MRPDVICILGVGRSGSTVVERLLGSAPEAAGLGEVHCLWRRPLAALTCACGAPGPDCGFWAEARARAGLTDAALATLAALERTAIRHRRLILRAVKGAPVHADPDMVRFLAMQENLFGALAEIAGARVLIDSSKAAPRAWALSAWPETRILHIRRRMRDVAASWRSGKPDPSTGRPMRRTAAALAREWAATELSAARLARRRPVARLDFERFAASPRRAVADLGFAPAGLAWTGAASFRPDADYHALSGNPDRFRGGDIVIAPPPPRVAALSEGYA